MFGTADKARSHEKAGKDDKDGVGAEHDRLEGRVAGVDSERAGVRYSGFETL